MVVQDYAAHRVGMKNLCEGLVCGKRPAILAPHLCMVRAETCEYTRADQRPVVGDEDFFFSSDMNAQSRSRDSALAFSNKTFAASS